MAYYTHDGARHQTIEEALHYLEQFITISAPFNDEYVKTIHEHNWGKYEVQCIPDDTESLYLELNRNYIHNGQLLGVNRILYHEAIKPEDVNEVLNFLDKQKAILDMINSEIRSHLVDWSQDGRHLDIADDESVIPLSLNMSISHSGEHGEPNEDLSVEFMLDEVIHGIVSITGKDPLVAVLAAVENRILLELEGDIHEDEVNGYNVIHLIDTAQRENMNINIKLSEKVIESQE